MVIQINFSNRTLYTLIALFLILNVGVIVYAFGGNQPSVVGHSAGELDLTTGGLNRFSVNYPSTGVYDDVTSNSPYSRVNADSFHTNGIGAGQIYIEGSAIDSNGKILIGTGSAGGQSAQTTKLGGALEFSDGTTQTSAYPVYAP